MYRKRKYIATDPMSELICDNDHMLLVMSRFGIDFGFGEDSIGEVCKKSGVDIATFLAVVNLLIAENKRSLNINLMGISLSSLIQYLKESHRYFADYRLPDIRRKLVAEIDNSSDLAVVILNYYDEYQAEVHKHMVYEEETLFPYIESTIAGGDNTKYNIDIFTKHHSKVDDKLAEFKNIFIKYYPSKSTNELNSILYDIFSCERDLVLHSEIEDFLLVPTMRMLEQQQSTK